MPKFKIHYEITGELEITADDAHHAQEQFDRFTKEQLARRGELESFEPEDVPRDTDGEQIDRHWNRVKESV